MIDRIEQVQRELAEIRAYHQGYLDRRARSGMTTATDTVLSQHKETLAKTVDLLEALKAEKISEAEGEQPLA